MLDLCCPFETLFVCTGRIASPLLKSFRRQKERSYKSRDSSAVKHYTDLIKAEIKRPSASYASQLLPCNNSKRIWQVIKLLFGIESKTSDGTTDLDSVNAAIIHPSSDAITPFVLDDAVQVEAVSKEETLELWRTVKTTCRVSPDGLSSSLLRYGA
ncbi:unnamed protein product [Echinostoma caproni]|uniref:Uncharacterized protein n=1 Tax=Echinostoma caproni TaxID=27848 RepID=A0A183AKH7_9TREM|nr:unnamed protein product [Echinostoma caproni]